MLTLLSAAVLLLLGVAAPLAAGLIGAEREPRSPRMALEAQRLLGVPVRTLRD